MRRKDSVGGGEGGLGVFGSISYHVFFPSLFWSDKGGGRKGKKKHTDDPNQLLRYLFPDKDVSKLCRELVGEVDRLDGCKAASLKT